MTWKCTTTTTIICTCQFDTYFGIPFDDHHPQRVPIPAIDMGNTKQIPFRLAWALTIHKSQGLTLQNATIDIGPIERSSLTFFAIHMSNLCKE